ncbi:MAG: DNA polymerase III subunit gamma/tau [Gammaproteobacteria bacterium]
MSYQVLARKWRPRTFEQMVGQQHVLRALINALDGDRLHHAYLFSGTRGVGKTTLARILAKCLNCETGVSAKPCQKCAACLEIDEGRFVDLIEVDAASRTKVEQTRELLDNVQYAPSRGGYKVYLIDEVHMLSGASFNALLKTLEEPPPHVKFLLATTDPQKLPMTVLSRCLQFNLKRLTPKMIADHLQYVLGEEGVAADEGAVRELSRAADGSMRDALSLMDQAIAHGGGELRVAEVQAMLGTLSADSLNGLFAALTRADAPAVMKAVSALDEQAADFDRVLEELLSVLHRVALRQALPDYSDDGDGNHEEAVRALAGALAPEDTQLWYQICLIGRRDLPLAIDSKSGFEMILLRLLGFRPETAFEVSPSAASGRSSVAAEPQEAQARPDAVPAAATAEDLTQIVPTLALKGAASALASNCSFRSKEGSVVRLVLDKQHLPIRTPTAEQRIQQALGRHYAEEVRLIIDVDEHASATPDQLRRAAEDALQQTAERAIEEDTMVQAFKKDFDATVVPGTVRPVGED